MIRRSSRGSAPFQPPGHTQGHTSYSIESRGQKLLVWGDIVHVAPIQFPDPSVTVKYDNNEDQVEKEREQLFADAAKKGYWIGPRPENLGQMRCGCCLYANVHARYGVKVDMP